MRVLLVDDEVAVVAIMKRAIDWESIGIDELFTAHNASDAKNILLKDRIDIMVCDIEMPKESGLDLIRWVREKKMELECIILTAFPNFDYAKEAIPLQINNYLVKPVVYAELSKAITDSVDKILRKQAEERYKMIGSSILSDRRKNMKMFLNKLIWEDTTLSEIEKDAKMHGLNMDDFRDVDMVIFRCINIRSLLKKNGKIVRFAFENVLDELIQDSVNLCVEYTPVVLCKDRDEEELRALCQKFISASERYLKSQMSAFAVRNIDIQEISSSYDLLHDIAEMSIYEKGQVQIVQKQELSADQEKLIFDRQRWKKLFELKSAGMIESLGREELKLAELEGMLNRDYLRTYQKELLRLYYAVCDSETDMTADKLDAFEKASDSTEEMIRWLYRLVCETESRPQDGKHMYIRKAREYLEAHYNEPIGKEDIERQMNLNRDYLNRIFKSTTGYSLMEYVQNYRIFMAKRMLAESRDSISQICFLVGYDSPPYFSKIFKKLVGQTPLEYRNQKMSAD